VVAVVEAQRFVEVPFESVVVVVVVAVVAVAVVVAVGVGS
jgi:hypothetical protein